ncbi:MULTISPECIES: polyphosphate kinase 2 family protein [Cyanophyceae]|uniref:polyphosphate kinase 2 family protein n=1 Tax=Cyanophyceae TaxID=3028117 RepID=UPI00168834D3|nr:MULTISPECIES: polyphosphate kinase 2 family protein [Cyanophyceae]MBD1918506.1 polyphosphate kinase 2 family protein [Phormidium sp. FACHB-77]MBD2031395.1 polyphosphate kinase 2 family protein [Phormidium sp. FACHB-322]MBD2049515.1 polyphosphate kinase 2 family protein [Leptolyngbya sp. FACHB-60]
MDSNSFLAALNPDSMVVKPSRRVKLKDFDSSFTGGFNKKTAKELLQQSVEELSSYQNVLYAQNTYALLLIFQAMDAAGKDSTIKHVMSGVNPQGCQVFSFKQPSSEELDHDYLWRSFKALPERGNIGIFNRSYYEEVLIVRVHPALLDQQQLPQSTLGKDIWQQRFEEINNFEKYLVNNGIVVMKFFLNVSKEEQKKRFLERIDRPEKNWKFSIADVQERGHWKDYMAAYEGTFTHTSTDWAPWHIIPADNKWFTRLAVASLVCQKLKSLNLAFPVLEDNHMERLHEARVMLESEE